MSHTAGRDPVPFEPGSAFPAPAGQSRLRPPGGRFPDQDRMNDVDRCLKAEASTAGDTDELAGLIIALDVT